MQDGHEIRVDFDEGLHRVKELYLMFPSDLVAVTRCENWRIYRIRLTI